MNRLLLLLSLMLAALVAAEWWYWPAEPPSFSERAAGRGAGVDTPLEAATEFQLPPLESYGAVTRRPLFFEGRRTPKPEASPNNGSTGSGKKRDAPLIKLAAILIIDKKRYALIRDPKGKRKLRRLKQGEKYEGWRVTEIKPDRLVLSAGKAHQEYPLRAFKKVPLPRVTKRRLVPKTVQEKMPGKPLKRANKKDS